MSLGFPSNSFGRLLDRNVFLCLTRRIPDTAGSSLFAQGILRAGKEGLEAGCRTGVFSRPA